MLVIYPLCISGCIECRYKCFHYHILQVSISPHDGFYSCIAEKSFALQSRLDKGEFNSATTRVLHFIANPEAEARKEHQSDRILELEAEVSLLKLQSSLTDAAQKDKISGTDNTALAALEAKAVVTEQKVRS